MIFSTERDFKQPIIQYVGKGKERRYDIIEPYCFEWEENGTFYRRYVNSTVDACIVGAPESCLEDTDLASVPKLAGISSALGFEPYGPSDGAAILHDQAYRCKGNFGFGEFMILQDSGWIDCQEPFTRKRADALYRKMAILGGMSKAKADIEWAALRLGAIPKEGKFKQKMAWYFS